MEKKIGNYSFIIGVIVALILGLFGSNLSLDAKAWLLSLVVVLGLIVGFLNVTGKETKEFLVVAAVLVFMAYAGGDAFKGMADVQVLGDYILGVLNMLLAFIVPAATVVALKDVYALAQNK